MFHQSILQIMRKLILLTLSLTAIYSCKVDKKDPIAESPVSTEISDSITHKLDSIYAIGRIQGFGVAVSDAAGTLYSSGFGTMDLEQDKPYSESTVQNIGSISKTFIGIALMKAQEQGALKLDDDVNKHLPFKIVNPNFPETPITIRQLASHTSSIRDTDVYDREAYILKETTADSLLSVVEETLNPPESKIPFIEFLPEVLVETGEYYSEEVYLNHKPGTLFEYSNIGATLAALVLEMATEVPFDQFTAEYVLKPLKMNDSGWSFEAVKMENHSKLYTGDGSEIPFYELITYPDGGLRSSANDMSLYLTELIRAYQGKGSLLSKDSYKEYFTPILNDGHFEEERDADFPYNDEYNMGVFMAHTGVGTIGHTGGDPGISSFLFFDPETGQGLYLMINTSIVDEKGINQLFGIMSVLEEYAGKLRK